MKAFLVVNPTSVDTLDELKNALVALCADRGWEVPVTIETTAADPGTGQARRAVSEGADLVLSCGGDGTVRCVATGMAGSGVPLGILPAGTGNLLARNLDLPLDVDEALELAFDGVDRLLDVGRVGEGDERECFVVMAGVGFDAEMMKDAPAALKSHVGWPAYVVSGVKHLRGSAMRLSLTIDDQPQIARRARMVLVGNVGTLQGGLELLPDARPDDGLLDVVVLAPSGMADWVRIVTRLIRRSKTEDQRVERFTGRRISIAVQRSTPSQLDGDPVGDARSMICEIAPGALVVRVKP